MVRVDSLDDLLDEIETLGVGRVAAGATATLITSDRGVATLACDAFAAAGDTLAQWPAETTEAVTKALPRAVARQPAAAWRRCAGRAFRHGPARSLHSIARPGQRSSSHASTHNAPVAEVAQALIASQGSPIAGCWRVSLVGWTRQTRDALHAQGIPVHTTPQRLARAFARLVDYRLGRELLMQTPEGLPAQIPAETDAAQAQARAALAAGEDTLTETHAASLLAHFGLRVEPREATQDKIVDIEVELHDDDNFGPVFRFTTPSADGVSAPLRVFGLPPLNPMLARDMVTRSPYARVAAPEPVLEAFTALSQAVCDVREIVGLQLALRVFREHVSVMAPCIRLGARRSRLAIMPYPRRYEETLDWHGLRITVRPIRPEDEAAHHDFVEAMTPDDLRLRFFGAVGSFDHSQLARMTQIDYDREMALIATIPCDEGFSRTLGVVRAVADPDNETAEFAVAIRSDQKGRRLGKLLMEKIIAYARSRGTHWLVGEALRENTPMIALAKACGFTVAPTEDPAVVEFRMPLDEAETVA